jgi:mRNA interferase MazF
MSRKFKRGEVYWGELDPVRGAEISKTRPCVIISSTALNAVRKTVVIVPLTTTPSPPSWPLVLTVHSVSASSKARIEQLRGVDKSRLGKYMADVSDEDMVAIDVALKKVLVLG